MSDVIQLLPDSVANQIAAGEVIQRPASVIKELVENAVDAGARNIQVVVVDAGRTNIQVIDDGKGMSETDARLAFERHSTSKIRKADDLFALRTMGFRGEALASIAAVAQVELKTRQESDEIGTLVAISGSRYERQEPCACPVGTNFSVSNIFYNVPARRKFLKSNSTELNNILTAFERIALVNPQISFTLHSNGTEVFNLRAAKVRNCRQHLQRQNEEQQHQFQRFQFQESQFQFHFLLSFIFSLFKLSSVISTCFKSYAKVRKYSCPAKRRATFLLLLQHFSFFTARIKVKRKIFCIFAVEIKI